MVKCDDGRQTMHEVKGQTNKRKMHLHVYLHNKLTRNNHYWCLRFLEYIIHILIFLEFDVTGVRNMGLT